MTERIYKVSCIDGRLYLNHHGVSDYVGDEDCTNEKAIIQIGQYLNELTHENERLKKEKQGILKRIDDYIWEWEDEGTPVADEMKQLKKDIEKGYLEW